MTTREAGDVLNEAFGLKVHQVGRPDLGIPPKDYYATDKRITNTQAALYEDLMELLPKKWSSRKKFPHPTVIRFEAWNEAIDQMEQAIKAYFGQGDV